MASRSRPLGESARSGIEPRQIPSLPRQQLFESRHAVIVSGNRGQLGVVEPFLQPLLVVPHAQLMLERVSLLGDMGQLLGLFLPHLRRGQSRGVQLLQLCAPAGKQADESALLVPIIAERLHQIRTTAQFEPALKTDLLHCRREGLVEC